MKWRTPLLALVGYSIVLRLIYSVRVELLPEEAYYWNYSRHLDIGYLDHPPLVAWLIRAGTALFGDTALGVRSAALCCGAVTALFIYRLTRNIFGEASALLAVAMTQALPFFFLSGLLMTPDAPLCAAWAAALYFLERVLIAGHARSWFGVGLAVGIGLISKYTIGLVVMAALIFMLIDPASRRWFRRWEPYAAMLIAAAVFAPVILWNAQNDWASFVFQTSRRLAEAPRFSLHKLIGSAMVLLSPVGLWAAVAALSSFPDRDRGRRLLQLAVLWALSVFALFSVRHEVKLDWTGAPWTAVLPLMAAALASPNRGGGTARRGLRTGWAMTLIAMPLLYTAGFIYLVIGIPGAGATEHMELVPVGWRNFAQQIDRIAGSVNVRYGERPLVVGMDRYAIASELAFYSDDQSRAVADTSSAHLFGDIGLMYEWWFPPRLQTGRTLLLVAWDPASLATAHVGNRVAQLEPMQQGELERNGRPLRRFYYRIGRDYKSP